MEFVSSFCLLHIALVSTLLYNKSDFTWNAYVVVVVVVASAIHQHLLHIKQKYMNKLCVVIQRKKTTFACVTCLNFGQVFGGLIVQDNLINTESHAHFGWIKTRYVTLLLVFHFGIQKKIWINGILPKIRIFHRQFYWNAVFVKLVYFHTYVIINARLNWTLCVAAFLGHVRRNYGVWFNKSRKSKILKSQLRNCFKRRKKEAKNKNKKHNGMQASKCDSGKKQVRITIVDIGRGYFYPLQAMWKSQINTHTHTHIRSDDIRQFCSEKWFSFFCSFVRSKINMYPVY